MDALEFEGVSVRYGAVRALEGVSGALRAGERVAVIGPNGGGKTTLLRVLAGIVRPAAGEVWCRGQRLHALSRVEIARQIGFLPQEEHWEFPFTVEEVVRCGRFARATALYRETRDKIKTYRFRGVLGVEMEVASFYAVCAARGLRAVAFLVVSDLLLDDAWKPGFFNPEFKKGVRKLGVFLKEQAIV